MPFETLDTEVMNTTTLKYAKSVMQLEKGLPPNGVVPVLKERVEEMRERVSILNPFTPTDRFSSIQNKE